MLKVKHISLSPTIVSPVTNPNGEEIYFIGRAAIIHYEDGTHRRAYNSTGDYCRMVTEEEREDEGVLVINMYEPKTLTPVLKYFKKIPVVNNY
jgi:hypothetical protein